MKSTQQILTALALLGLAGSVLTAAPLGTAFTYQGKLTSGGNPATGIYDLRLTIYDALNGGVAVGGPLTNSAVVVTNGLFVVALDFGSGVFAGDARWLEIGVRTNGSAGGFTTLAPRQPVTPTPYALQAANALSAVTAATLSGTLPASQVTGRLAENQLSTNVAMLTSSPNFNGTITAVSFSGNGAGVTNVNLATANSGGAVIWTTNWCGFIPTCYLPVGTNPVSVTTADVNGDGWVDLVGANYGDDTLTVLTNNHSGCFEFCATLHAGGYPWSVTAADVNKDGWVDLICANFSDDTLTVLINNGHGGFTIASSPGVGLAPVSVTAADVNKDGWVDLICANFSADTLTVLINNGHGGFAIASSPSVGLAPVSVTAADVNHDGFVDLICANSGDDTLTVLINNGSGGFAIASSPSVGPGPLSVTAADVNQDGFVDLISANSGNDTLTVLINNGSGGFAIASSPGVGHEPDSVVTADVNGDGWADLISANYGNNTLTVLTNNRSGGFVIATSPGVGLNPHSVTAADVNEDGRPDLISANYNANTLTVLSNALCLDLIWSGDSTFNGIVVATNQNNQFAGTFLGDTHGIHYGDSYGTHYGDTYGTHYGDSYGEHYGSNHGTFFGDGSGLTDLNAAELTGILPGTALFGSYPNAVQLNNNANTFHGAFTGDLKGNADTATTADSANSVAAANIVAGLAPIDISGNAANVSGTVAVGNGGTGASTAAVARDNLGAAASGANEDITSLSGLTTPLSIAHGGTGAGDAVTALNNLGGISLGGDNLFTGENRFSPDNDVTGLTLRQTTATLPTKDILAVQSSDGVNTFLRVNHSGTVAWAGTAAGDISGNAATATTADSANSVAAANIVAGLAPIDISGNAANVSGTVAVGNGGTGASTAAVARDNLGAAASGANEDITSLSGLTTPLSIAHGGTGAGDAVTALNNLGGISLGGDNLFTGENRFSPDNDVTGLTLRQTTATSPTKDILAVQSSDGVNTFLRVNHSGTVAWAGTAAGNISGNAATATTADSANSVAAANIVAGLAPIDISGNAANVSGTVAVGNGGTGASTAAVARDNLGAAASGANEDITSLSGLTTPLSIAHGGTGAGDAGAALNNLGGISLDGDNTFTGENRFSPANDVTGLTLRQTTAASPTKDILAVQSSDGLNTFLRVNHSGTVAWAGTAAGNISGTAASVANGVYTTGLYANPTWIQSLAGSKITGDISGNAASFNGSLVGDVTGVQLHTVVSTVGGQTAAIVASGATAAYAADSANTPNSIVKRDVPGGNFTAGDITANHFIGNGSQLTGITVGSVPAANIGPGTANISISGSAASFSGSLGGDVTGSQISTHVASVGGQTAAFVASGASAANAATSLNTPYAIVKRDASGNFSAGTVTLNGTLTLPATTASAGIIYLDGNPWLHAYGDDNIFVGELAGNFTMSGSGNTAIGTEALASNTSGYNNTANGTSALASNTSGTDNTANGAGALFNNTTGTGNTASGSVALLGNTLGSDNTASGSGALFKNTGGIKNTADGNSALFNNTVGSYNIALGFEAGYNITTGTYNIDIGNPGVSTDNNIIRIGSGQDQAFIAGVITGNGGGLNNLNASQLASGNVPDARLSGNVPLRNGSPAFSTPVTMGSFLSLAQTVIVPGNGDTIVPTSSYVLLNPGAPVMIGISSGSRIGDVLILQVSSGNPHNVNVPNGGNIKLSAGNHVLGANDTLMLIWTSAGWTEVAFTNNL